MAITAIVGEGGVGKTSLEVFFLEQYALEHGQERLRKCIAEIDKYNLNRKNKLIKPDKYPIFTNFDVTIPIGYRRDFTPYFLNPYHFGIPNLDKEVQPIPPYGVIIFTESDKVYDSREKSLPEAASGIYNKQRHFHLDIILELHRGMNADTLVRSNVHRFIEIQKQEREENSFKEVTKTTWFCREFEGAKNYLRYVNSHGNEKTYKETVYTHVGNIFAYYNSRACAEEFIPKEGQNFSLIQQPSKADIKKLPPEIAKFYNQGEPPNWRKKADETK